jgi:chemotaxis protein CheX
MPTSESSQTALVVDHASWKTLLNLSAQEVFEMMLGCRIAPLANTCTPAATDFTAMVGLAGKLCGVLSVRCSTRAALLVTAKMLAIPLEDVEDGCWDALGELANMIAGNFKAKLNGVGSHCLLSVPTVITGADYQTHSLTNGAAIETAIEFETFPMWITLELHN